MFSQQFVMPRAWPVPSFTKGPTGHRAAGDLWPRQQVCCDEMEECGGKVVHSNRFLFEHPGDKFFLVLQGVTATLLNRLPKLAKSYSVMAHCLK